jgi:DNA mismatch repair protein MutS2
MNKKVLQILEFDKIARKLGEKAVSEKAKRLCVELSPSSELSEVKKALAFTGEAALMVFRRGSLPLGGFSDVSSSLKRVEMFGALSIPEILKIGDFLRAVEKVVSYYEEFDGDSFPNLYNYFSALTPVPPLEREINRCIENENTVSERASAKLSSIRNETRVAMNRIKEKLNSIIHSANYSKWLSDSIITIRNGRYCVPVKQEYKNSFPGMIHDQSASGATVFIEPMSVVNLNNDIKEMESEEKREIERILFALSEKIGEQKDVLEADLEILTFLDFTFAKGELARELDCCEPIFNADGYINIKRGRHPLLKGEVVPVDIYLGKDFTTLLITGPNTGGKTVSLKTLGLFSLMGQSGLFIPAFEGSELNVFDNIFADIGDEQSIEQSLSTFSSHMTNIVKILEELTDNSLVLLDELGAGTDPTEGAALAAAILQLLLERQIRCAVTTHYSELKMYALSTPGVMNAACEFDADLLRPTYKLLIGAPGKSAAFAISKRLGLAEPIIEAARNFLSRENIKFEDLLSDLEINKKTAELEMEKAARYRREAEELNSEIKSRREKMEAQREKIIDEAKRNARAIMQSAKEEAGRLLKEIDAQKSRKEIEAARSKLSENIEALEVEEKSPNRFPVNRKLEPGEKVFIVSLNQSGTVVNWQDENRVAVSTGALKVIVASGDLSLEERSDKTDKKQSKGKRDSITSVSYSGVKKNAFIKPQIDLRGKLVDEALVVLDKYLDDAILAGMKKMTIIHGKGTGALREAITAYLKNRRDVKNRRLGEMSEGGAGATIVELE